MQKQLNELAGTIDIPDGEHSLCCATIQIVIPEPSTYNMPLSEQDRYLDRIKTSWLFTASLGCQLSILPFRYADLLAESLEGSERPSKCSVEFSLSNTGDLIELSLTASTADRKFDDLVQKTIVNATPFPRLPVEAPPKIRIKMNFACPVVMRLYEERQ